jgi:hypothetical protein
MSVTEKLNYDQIRDNVLQLSPAERFRLVRELKETHEQITETKLPEPDNSGFTELWRENGMVCYRVNGDPIFTPEEFEEFEENRKRLEAETQKIPREEIEKKREKAIHAALALPACSDEEWAEIQEMRRILRPCQPFF